MLLQTMHNQNHILEVCAWEFATIKTRQSDDISAVFLSITPSHDSSNENEAFELLHLTKSNQFIISNVLSKLQKL